MADKLTDNIIKKDLLKRNNFISIVVICSVFISIALINLFVGIIVSVIYNEAGIALLTTGAICAVLILFAFLFAIFMNIKKAYKERNNILNNKYKVVNDTCLNIEKNEVDDDGPVTEYTWHFADTKSKISKYGHNINLEEYQSKKFILVFLDGESQPTLFYNAEKFNYEETV